MGKISQLISDIDDEPTPLQKRLAELGKIVAVICLIVCIAVFGAGVLRGENVFEMLFLVDHSLPLIIIVDFSCDS